MKLEIGDIIYYRNIQDFEGEPKFFTKPGVKYRLIHSFYTSSTHRDGREEYIFELVDINRSTKIQDMFYRDDGDISKYLYFRRENFFKEQSDGSFYDGFFYIIKNNLGTKQ